MNSVAAQLGDHLVRGAAPGIAHTVLFPGGVEDTVGIELWNCVQAVQGKAELEVDGLEGLKDLAISMSIYESSELGRPVEVAAVERCEIENYQAELNEAAGL